MEDSTGGHSWILLSFLLDLFPLFIFCTLNLGIVIIKFETLCCMKWTKYCKFYSLLDFGCKHGLFQVLLVGCARRNYLK